MSTGLALSALVLVAACAPGKPYKYKNPQLVADPDKVSAQLAQAADRASNALQTLAAVEQTRTPSASTAPLDDVPMELKRAVSIEWVGPAEEVLLQMANRASYSFDVIGEGPSNPLIVTLNVENTPIIDVLRSIGYQVGTQGDVSVDAVQKRVELRYTSLIAPAEVF
jgi:defect-in-organelle-trafficking protein DotD